MRRLLLCLLLLAAAPAAARAQEPSPVQTELAAPAGEAAGVAAAAPAQSSGLPTAATPPRTLRAYWHVFIAFAVAWALLFGYAILLARKGGALERQLKRLEGTGA